MPLYSEFRSYCRFHQSEELLKTGIFIGGEGIHIVSEQIATPTLANTRKLTIIAQDPSVTIGDRILTTEVDIPAEELLPGPCGYRINVIDYDATNNVLYEPAELQSRQGKYLDPFSKSSLRKLSAAAFNRS